MASNRGPAAVAPPPNYNNDAAYYKSRDNGNAYAWAQKGAGGAAGVGGSWASAAPGVAAQARELYQHQPTPSIAVTGGMTSSTTSGGGTAVADGSYEKQLIMELCPPGGMKAEPPPDKLNQFSRSVASLNPDLVCPVLLDCLEEGQPWIIRAKALWVIESCIKHGQKPGEASNAYTDFFHACSGEIAPLANHTRAQIRDPAKRVLNLMGVAVPAPGAVAPPISAPVAVPAPPAPSAPVQNLLDFDDSPAPAQAPPAAGDASLFGGLNVVGSTPAAPSAAAPPPPSSGNLLGDWLSEPSSAAESAAPAPAEVSLFGNMTIKDSPAPAQAPDPDVSSMFDSMSVKGEDPSTLVESSSTQRGSAFGFINQSTAVDIHTEKKTDTVLNAQSRDSFDPLKHMTPNTAQRRHGSSGMYMPQMQGVMQNNAAAKTSFAFMDKPPKTEDKKFDFIQDAISMEKKK